MIIDDRQTLPSQEIAAPQEVPQESQTTGMVNHSPLSISNKLAFLFGMIVSIGAFSLIGIMILLRILL